MNKSILLIGALFLHLVVFAQKEVNVKVSWGSEFFLPENHLNIGLLGSQKDGYIQIGHAYGKTLSIQQFDATFKLKAEKFISLNNIPKGYMSEVFLEYNEKYYWFYSIWDKSAKLERLFVQEIDVKKGDLKGSAKVLLTSRKLTIGVFVGLEKQYSTQKWKISTSLDQKSTLLVRYRVKPIEKIDNQNKDLIGLFVFDENLNKLWGKEHEMPYTEAQMDNVSYTVDNGGNVLLLAKIKNDLNEKNKNKPNYRFEVLKWGAKDSKVQVIQFNLEDKFVNEAVIKSDNTGTPWVVGYFSKKNHEKSITNTAEGFFVLKIKPNSNSLENVFKGTYEFPSDLIKQFESKKEKKKDELEVFSLTFRNLHVWKDGSISFTGEQYWYTSYTTQNGNERTIYHFDDIYTAKIGADGDLKYVTKIPKKQNGGEGISDLKSGLSLKTYVYYGKQYFLFLDNLENLALSPNAQPTPYGDSYDGVLMLIGIDENGKTTKSKVFDFKEEKSNLNVADFKEVGSNQLLSISYGKKRNGKPFVLTFE